MLHSKALQKTAFDHSLIKKKLLALRAATTEDQELKIIEYELNNGPRKRLGFKTPHQVFWGSNKSVGPRS